MTNKLKIPFALGVAVTLAIAAGGQLTGGGGLNFVVHDAATMTGSGTTLSPLVGKGNYLATQVLTSSSGTYTPTSGTTRIHVRMVGGGGGGGGAGGGANQAAGGGGGAGVLLEFWAGTAGTSITGGAFACGAAGSAGANTGGTGGTGGDTTLVAAGTTWTAKGATGGTGMSTTASPATAPGGIGQAGSSSGTGVVGSASTRGNMGFVAGTAAPFAGRGGDVLPIGTSGAPGNGPGAGGAASGFGAGGGGGTATASGNVGGAGAAGAIVIEEFSFLWRRHPRNDDVADREILAA